MDGIIIVNKPTGITSYDVIRFIKKTFYPFRSKIGHSGTLDPLAEGVLIVCIGRATKLSERFMNQEKEYIAKLLLGKKTDTDDIEGKVLEEKEVNVTGDEVLKVIKDFEGEIEQIPPVVSALKHKGQPFYKLHRKGILVFPSPRKILIKKIEMLNMALPHIEFKVLCSRGTYIRALCRDIGDKLGCGAVQVGLKRTRIGQLSITESLTLKQIEKNGLENSLIPLNKTLQFLSPPVSECQQL